MKIKNFKRRDSDFKVDLFLFFALACLLLNFRFQIWAFPLQCLIALYAIFRSDVRYIPVVYLALQDASYFKFLGVDTLIKVVVVIPISVQNVFVIGTFFFAISRFALQRFNGKYAVIFLFWLSTVIPAIYISTMAKADGLLAVWQTPLILFMLPSFYFWGVEMGRTWDFGKVYFVKRMVVIFFLQMVLQLMMQYRVGCAFQDTIIPICFFIALLSLPKNIVIKTIAMAGAGVALAVMLLNRYFNKLEEAGYAGNMELVSTFSRLGVTFVGVLISVTAGKILRGHTLRSFPYVALVLCVAIFAYATIRANTKIQGNVVKASGATTFSERFESKLVGDRGHVWLDAIQTELFRPPLIFKRYKDIAVYIPEVGSWVEKMRPHNQVLTLLCRSGWWMGLVMVLFLWWLHIREFKAAALIASDKFTLCTLLAPSAAIFIVVGLTGQHVFTQAWHASSMASLTFPGILYGAVQERIRHGRTIVQR